MIIQNLVPKTGKHNKGEFISLFKKIGRERSSFYKRVLVRLVVAGYKLSTLSWNDGAFLDIETMNFLTVCVAARAVYCCVCSGVERL